MDFVHPPGGGHPEFDAQVRQVWAKLGGGRQVTTDNEKVCIGPDRVLDEPFETLCSVLEVSVFLQMKIAAGRDFHPIPPKEFLVGPTLVNQNRFQQEHHGQENVGADQYQVYRKHPMGGKEIETDE
jgi:hypothetical protein